MAAAIWIGTNVVQMILSSPARSPNKLLRDQTEPQNLGRTFRPFVDLCIIVLIATGAIIVFNRLASNDVTLAYVVTLSIKIALTAWMFILVHAERRRLAVISNYENQNCVRSGWLQRTKLLVSGYNGITVIGIVVFFLSDLLRSLFEQIIRLN